MFSHLTLSLCQQVESDSIFFLLMFFILPAAVCPLKHCNLSPVSQSHMPTVLSNEAVMTLSSSKRTSAQV